MQLRYLFALVFLTGIVSAALADGMLYSWGPQWIVGMTEERAERAAERSPEEILAFNLKAKTWADTFEVLIGAAQHREDREFTAALIEQLGNREARRLVDTRRLIIWERIELGEILFEGKGYQSSDDLFSVAGRANWVLRNTFEVDYGHVHVDSSPGELEELQFLWLEHFAGNNPPVWETPCPCDKGDDALYSIEALRAMIASLKPSREKERVTKDCLKNLYGLDELPKERGAPGRLCDPDSYTLVWLALIAGEEADGDYDWWSKWWKVHGDNIEWNREQCRFEIVSD